MLELAGDIRCIPDDSKLELTLRGLNSVGRPPTYCLELAGPPPLFEANFSTPRPCRCGGLLGSNLEGIVRERSLSLSKIVDEFD